jgi:hypothetical protein
MARRGVSRESWREEGSGDERSASSSKDARGEREKVFDAFEKKCRRRERK